MLGFAIAPAGAADAPAFTHAAAAISTSAPESEAEARAMSLAIAAVRAAGAPPVIPAEALNSASAATAARIMGLAARAAPWVAEYHFSRGGMLAKAGADAAAARAFALYLEAAPDARDRAEVLKLITGLRHSQTPRGADIAPDSSAKRPRPVGEVFRDCPKCPEMVIVPAGHFTMGSPASEIGRFDSEGPQHGVTVRGFALGKYPVTEEEFTIFLATTGYQPAPCDRILDKTWRSPGGGIVFPPGQADLPRQPAVCVNWKDVHAYIAWMNANHNPAGSAPYRLPTEAEWEYAARAGAASARWWGEALGRGNANCHGCGSDWDNTLIAPVGSFQANAFGLHDMLGNTWEWLADCWNENYSGAPADGSAWTSGDCSKRVMRGGSWSNLPAFIRSAARSRGDAGGADFDYSSYVGFRLAKSIP
jgi:formylglycine-generating enzyme required for sulfatase activity